MIPEYALEHELLSIRMDSLLKKTQEGEARIIAGKYEIVKLLGAGSKGVVYLCRHQELSGHMVAVKVLCPELVKDKVAADRFRNEIFAAYGVSHPNVVRVYEYARDDDFMALTMEYVDGGDLADRLESADPVPLTEVIEILRQICSGLQAIHDAELVHRNLKPENILLTKEGQVKIADFCIAQAVPGPKLTDHGGVVGTIDYVSPEFMLNSSIDSRSDIYSVGCIAYEMITGQSPFCGDSVYATMTKRLKKEPPAPSSIRQDCPKELDQTVLKAMARNPDERYQSAAALREYLEAIKPI
jgi:eukaryotic-like serine/threonine-protein kinase